jgi:hypothetical protein
MSFQVTEAFVQQYSSTLYTLAQQKGSLLRNYVRTESIVGKARSFDRIGPVTAQKRTTRHGDTPQMDTPHSRRWVYLSDYEWADMIDDLDKIRMLIDPTSDYLMAAMWALGRSMDDELIAAADADVKTGETAATTVSLPDTQRLAASDGTNFSNLNVRTLRALKLKFDAAQIDPSITRHIAVTSSQLYSLLGETQVTSFDYNSVKALVQGQVNTFMGFQFHQIERLGSDQSGALANVTTGAFGSGSAVTGFRKAIAWAQDGLILGIGKEMKSEIAKRPDKGFNTQAYAMMSVGAVRMEEQKVVMVFCKEN